MQLSDLLEPLDWSRQAATNFGEGSLGLLGGDFSRDNFAKVVPGAAGILAGALTGGTMAAPVGALTGALVQGGGKYFNPSAMKALSTQDLVQRLGGDPESTWQNLGVHMATDPFTYAGLGMFGGAGKASNLASAATSGAEAAGESAGVGGRLAQMLGARRDITKLAFNPDTGEAALGAGRHMAGRDIGAFEKLLGEAYTPGWRGQAGSDLANPMFAVNANQAAAPLREATRHEAYHSLINRALNWGDTRGLSPMQKMTYHLYDRAGGQPGVIQGLGLLADETGAHAAQAGTSALRQAMGGADFLFGLPGSQVNRAAYASQLRDLSPSVGALYDALGIAPRAAGLGGAAAATALGARQLFKE